MAAVVEEGRARDDVTPTPVVNGLNLHTANVNDQRRDSESAVADDDNEDLAESVFSEDLGGATLERKNTNTEHTSVPKPGDVRINVKGAFIVEDDEEPGTPEELHQGDFEGEGYQLERRGIRLPNHKAVVSHIAVDVRIITFSHGESIGDG